MNCQLCGYERVPAEARWCPNCSQRLYRVASLDYTELVTERTQGFTGREWVFEAIDDWLADAEGARVFLLSGRPGTGKTAIAAQLVRMAEGEVPTQPYRHLGVGSTQFFHFCQAFHNDTLDPLRFTKALSLELARRYPAFAEALTRTGTQDSQIHVETRQKVGTASDQALLVGAIVVVENLSIGNLSARVAFDRVVAGPLKQIPQAGAKESILILVDALDEALTYPGETLVDLLGHALDDPRDLPFQVRLLLTSRPDKRASHFLGPSTLDLIADAPPNVDDVQAYAQRRLRALDEPKGSDLAGRVADASKGIFLYAQYVIDDLPADLEGVEDLAKLPLPEDLHDVYRQFLRRELGRALDTWDDDYAPLLGLLAVARGDGLTSAQLAGATKQRSTKMRRLLRMCGQYLAGPQPDGPFRIYHQSFREFLLEDTTYRIFPQESNQDIADFYLQKHSDKWGECDIYGLRHLPIHIVEAGYEDRLRELLFDFDWLQARLGATHVRGVLQDYDYGVDKDGELRVVHEAIKRSAQILQQDRAQLAAQLLGRLLARHEPGIQNLLDGATQWHGAPWLRPLNRSLIPPGDPLLFTLAGHEGTVRSLAITPDGRWGITADNSSLDRPVRLWDLGTGTGLRKLPDQADAGGFNPVALTPDGRWALVAREGDIHVWNVATGGEASLLRGHDGRITALAVADGGRRAISGAADGSVVLWDLARSEPGTWQRTVLPPPQPESEDEAAAEETIDQVAITPDGWYAATLSSGAVRHWDLERGQLTAELTWDKTSSSWHQRPPLALSHTGRRVFYGSPLRIWDVGGQTSRPAFSAHDPERVLAVAPDGEDGMTALVTPDEHTLEVWDIEEGARRATLPSQGSQAYVAALALTPDGQTALVAQYDHYLKVWALESTVPSVAAAVPGDRVDLTPDGRWATSAEGDAIVEIWDLKTGQPLSEPAARQAAEQTFRAAWRQRDARLKAAQAFIERHAESRSAPEPAERGPVTKASAKSSKSSGRRMSSIVIGPQRKPVVAAAGASHAITYVPVIGKTSEWEESGPPTARDALTLWNLTASDGQPIKLMGHSSPIEAVAMTPDGRLAISACVGRTVRVWDLKAAQELQTLRGHGGIVWDVAVASDGRYAVSASEDRSVRVWDLERWTPVAVYTSDLPMRNCAVSDDGRAIAARDVLGRVHMLQLES
jgi:WD40 repeat protein